MNYKIIIVGVALAFIIGIGVWQSEVRKWKQDPHQKKLDEIQDILGETEIQEIDLSSWNEFVNAELGISGKLPPGFRSSDYFEKIGIHDTIYITDLESGSEHTQFLKEDQKPFSEGVSPSEYGIIISKEKNEMKLTLEEWFKNYYQRQIGGNPYYTREEYRNVIIKSEDKEIFYFYDTQNLGRQLYGVISIPETEQMLLFHTSIVTTRINEEVKIFKAFVESIRKRI